MRTSSRTRRDFLKAVGLGAVSLPARQTLLAAEGRAKRPNVVLVMTDDQGYGDLACLGNSVIETPNLDRLHGESVRLSNFHVDPTCSPTRASLMTGRYSSRTGVWHTIMGRSLLHKDEVTMADVFAASGYRTGIFGKWHLGDNYPFRPEDRGFQEVLVHGGGGVGQGPDYWGNDYFDDTYRHNGELEAFKGYCTDVFFENAVEFIEANKGRPFFVYLPTNAPHGPYNVAEEYQKPYLAKGVEARQASFYGMITNIDDNMGRLMRRLRDLGLEKDTILIF
ncbi:MAG: sulfatase-like hydrolase/transferase, partial [Armatimonadota bacterium]